MVHHPLVVDPLVTDHHVQEGSRSHLGDLHLLDTGLNLSHVHHPGEAEKDLTTNVPVFSVCAITLNKTLFNNVFRILKHYLGQLTEEQSAGVVHRSQVLGAARGQGGHILLRAGYLARVGRGLETLATRGLRQLRVLS